MLQTIKNVDPDKSRLGRKGDLLGIVEERKRLIAELANAPNYHKSSSNLGTAGWERSSHGNCAREETYNHISKCTILSQN